MESKNNEEIPIIAIMPDMPIAHGTDGYVFLTAGIARLSPYTRAHIPAQTPSNAGAQTCRPDDLVPVKMLANRIGFNEDERSTRIWNGDCCNPRTIPSCMTGTESATGSHRSSGLGAVGHGRILDLEYRTRCAASVPGAHLEAVIEASMDSRSL